MKKHVLLLLLLAPFLHAEETRKPNILLIASDDLNHWIGYTGRNKQTKTPNIDKLSARGVSFSNAHATVPVCNGSRASLLSGVRPYTSGVYGNGDDWRKVIAPEKTLVSVFRQAGYLTLGSGKLYHGGFDRKTEWDDYLKNEGPAGPEPQGSKGVGGIRFGVVDAEDSELSDHRIVDYGISQLQKKHDKPFLLTVGLHKPHMPWFVPKKYFDLHPLESIELPPIKENDLDDVPAAGVRFARPDSDHKKIVDSGRWKEAVQAYLAAVSYADAEIGRLLDALESSEYREDTIVILLGDHGWHFGEKEHWRKFALWEEATRAPYIWVVPGVTKPGTISTRPVDFSSLYPTLTELAGVTKPAHVEGDSIRSLLADPAAEWKGHALSTWLQGNHSIRTENWRYTRYADGSEELYDHRTDPYEWTNLASSEDQASLKKELAALLPANNAPGLTKGDGMRDPEQGGGRRQNRGKRAGAAAGTTD
ncbi:sulfatase [Luteolibacter luteus]|uniref:Sulfatase n=1 Tax=Luteolibacter luteus TaxID=2728835 RepID=A0A858RCX1_9BACT|nr:sulfatase [Luteolibacter luteus]QJE94448.1 sulfatase [Luteolibacter luteus]